MPKDENERLGRRHFPPSSAGPKATVSSSGARASRFKSMESPPRPAAAAESNGTVNAQASPPRFLEGSTTFASHERLRSRSPNRSNTGRSSSQDRSRSPHQANSSSAYQSFAHGNRRALSPRSRARSRSADRFHPVRPYSLDRSPSPRRELHPASATPAYQSLLRGDGGVSSSRDRGRSPQPFVPQPIRARTDSPDRSRSLATVRHQASSSSTHDFGGSSGASMGRAFPAESSSSSPAERHSLSESFSWWAGLLRFTPGSEYRESRDLTHRNGRTRGPIAFAIKALSALDERAVGRSNTTRENLQFLQRGTGVDGAAQFSASLVVRRPDGRESRSVAFEPLYRSGGYLGMEQGTLLKKREIFKATGGTFPDFVATSQTHGGKLIAFDLKVPNKDGVRAYMETFHRFNGEGIEREFERRRTNMPRAEQRLLFDLVSGGLSYEKSKREIYEFAHGNRVGKERLFLADSVQFTYQGHDGVRASRPFPLNPPEAADAWMERMGSRSISSPSTTPKLRASGLRPRRAAAAAHITTSAPAAASADALASGTQSSSSSSSSNSSAAAAAASRKVKLGSSSARRADPRQSTTSPPASTTAASTTSQPSAGPPSLSPLIATATSSSSVSKQFNPPRPWNTTVASSSTHAALSSTRNSRASSTTSVARSASKGSQVTTIIPR